MSDQEATPRLTPTQRLHEVTIAALSRTPQKASEEVEITRNAKGDYQFTVTCVANEGEDLSDCSKRAYAIAEALAEAYPLSRKQTYDRDYLPGEK